MALLSRCRVLAACALVAWACGSPERAREPAPEPPPQPVRRIVAVSPSLTETLFALGLGDRMVGVGDYSHWPAEVAEKSRIGGLFDARIEQIVALEPDLAVLLPSEERLAGQLAGLGIEVLTVPSETLADVENGVRLIAQRTGAKEAGEAFLAQWRRELEPAGLVGEPTVLLSLAREPGRLHQILTAGPGTFLDELLERLGAVNLFGDAPTRYPQVGPEEIVRRRPQILLELQPEPLGEEEAELLTGDWSRLPGSRGEMEACVRVISGYHVLLPGPRLPRLYRELRQAIEECGGGGDGAESPEDDGGGSP